MVKNKVINESAYISELAVFGVQEKKGNEIVRLDLRNSKQFRNRLLCDLPCRLNHASKSYSQ